MRIQLFVITDGFWKDGNQIKIFLIFYISFDVTCILCIFTLSYSYRINEYKFSLYDEKLAGSLSLNTLFINIIHWFLFKYFKCYYSCNVTFCEFQKSFLSGLYLPVCIDVTKTEIIVTFYYQPKILGCLNLFVAEVRMCRSGCISRSWRIRRFRGIGKIISKRLHGVSLKRNQRTYSTNHTAISFNIRRWPPYRTVLRHSCES